MRKPDEIALARAMLTYDPCLNTGEGQPLHIRMGIPAKRWRYILNKWDRRKWLEYVDGAHSDEFQCFNHTGHRYWDNILSICDPTDSECVSSFTEYVRIRFSGALVLCEEVDRRSCCKSIAYNFGSYCVMQDGTYIHMCTVTFLE